MAASIPEKWIREYVDSLIEAAKMLGPNSTMGESAAKRAETILDMMKAYQDRGKDKHKHVR